MRTRLDYLKEELESIKNMDCLCFDLKEKCIKYYENEIQAIEVYNASNPIYDK